MCDYLFTARRLPAKRKRSKSPVPGSGTVAAKRKAQKAAAAAEAATNIVHRSQALSNPNLSSARELTGLLTGQITPGSYTYPSHFQPPGTPSGASIHSVTPNTPSGTGASNSTPATLMSPMSAAPNMVTPLGSTSGISGSNPNSPRLSAFSAVNPGELSNSAAGLGLLAAPRTTPMLAQSASCLIEKAVSECSDNNSAKAPGLAATVSSLAAHLASPAIAGPSSESSGNSPTPSHVTSLHAVRSAGPRLVNIQHGASTTVAKLTLTGMPIHINTHQTAATTTTPSSVSQIHHLLTSLGTKPVGQTVATSAKESPIQTGPAVVMATSPSLPPTPLSPIAKSAATVSALLSRQTPPTTTAPSAATQQDAERVQAIQKLQFHDFPLTTTTLNKTTGTALVTQAKILSDRQLDLNRLPKIHVTGATPTATKSILMTTTASTVVTFTSITKPSIDSTSSSQVTASTVSALSPVARASPQITKAVTAVSTSSEAGSTSTSPATETLGKVTSIIETPKTTKAESATVKTSIKSDTARPLKTDSPKVLKTDPPKLTKADSGKVTRNDSPKVTKTDSPKFMKTDSPKVSRELRTGPLSGGGDAPSPSPSSGCSSPAPITKLQAGGDGEAGGVVSSPSANTRSSKSTSSYTPTSKAGLPGIASTRTRRIRTPKQYDL